MEHLSPGLKTDKYEYTMLDAALASGVAHKQATFEVFARRLPQGRRYGVVAGAQRLLDALPTFLEGVDTLPFLSPEAREYLRSYQGRPLPLTLRGYREGELFFPYSPVLTVEGPFGLAVLLETLTLSIYNYDCAVAGAASRMVQAAQGRPVLDLGARRAHEDAAVAAARAAYITGFTGTSNLAAAEVYGIPAFGTSAHAFTLAHETEEEAFRAQVQALGPDTTLLVDTYDIAEGLRTAVRVAGPELGAVRIDSGDLLQETTKARALLDSLGATSTKIVVSSDLDEYAMDELLDTGAPIDSFGVGTRLVTGSGAPTASMVYKLVAIEDSSGAMRPVAKAASGKVSHGGKKYAWRSLNTLHEAVGEVLEVAGPDTLYKGNSFRRPLQVLLYKEGLRHYQDSLEDLRRHHATVLQELPSVHKTIAAGIPAFEATLSA